MSLSTILVLLKAGCLGVQHWRCAQRAPHLRCDQRVYEESLALNRGMGDKPSIAYALDNLGKVAYEQGDSVPATAL